ncbi:MAG: sugar ABC transporter permease [Lachnospiraceae bacterium]|nr:sugar ABC transporter permease [Lachnospiraceae bacterium]
MKKTRKKKNYSRYGYIFIAPFFISFLVFSLIPLFDTIKNSFYEYYFSGLKIVGPNFIGLGNYGAVLKAHMLKYTANTFILWILGFIPQIVIALLLASWFTDQHLNLKGRKAYEVIIYLPNLIMASAFAMLFFTLFSDSGPVNSFLHQIGVVHAGHPIKFLSSVTGTRGLIALMNFLMWFGNTTIMLMAAINGVNPELFEAAKIDGCNHRQIFFRITLPLIRPILTYTLITSMIGGLQMFDVPQILTNGIGTPDRTSMTLIMLLNNYLKSKNYGMAGAISIYLFILSGILCFIVYRMINTDETEAKAARKREKKMRKMIRKGDAA